MCLTKNSFTHCKNGHEFKEENTYITKLGYRQCKICNRGYYRAFLKRLRKLKLAA